MPNLAESMNLRAPLGTIAALKKAARIEKKRPSQIIREAVLDRLAASGVRVTKDAA